MVHRVENVNELVLSHRNSLNTFSKMSLFVYSFEVPTPTVTVKKTAQDMPGLLRTVTTGQQSSKNTSGLRREVSEMEAH